MTEESTRAQRSGWRGIVDRARASLQMSEKRRRLLLRAGIAGVAITLVLVIPGCLASQPDFLERYPDYELQVQTWQESVHAKVACQTCHVDPTWTAQAGYNVRMLGEFYLSRVLRSRQPDVLDTPSNAACASCHADLRTVSPSGDLNIPHRAHVDVLELDCVRCHEFLVHELSPEGKHVPRMVACMECHDGEQAKDACATCHTEKATPDSHDSPEWALVHADRQDEEDCEKCHGWTPDWCSECHSRKPVSHEGKWRSNHRYRVEEHRNCEVCHEADFCIRCHGEVPTLNFDPSLTLVQ